MVQQVTTREDLVPTAAAIAAEIAANAPLAVQSIKRTIDAFAYRGMAEALRFEALSASVEFVCEDMPAGYAAKAKKQPARIRGEVAAVGLPEPPPAGSPLLPADTFAGTDGGRDRGGHRPRAGHRRGAGPGGGGHRGRLAPEEHRLAGVAAVEAVGGRAAHAAGRHPRARADGRAPSSP